MNASFYHELTSDDQLTTYTRPQWEDTDEDGAPTASGEKNHPVSYTRNNKPTIGGRFKIENIKNQTIKIKAISPQGITLPEQTLTPTTGGVYVVPPTLSSTNFVNTVEFYDVKDASAFQLDWYVLLPSQNVWNKVGSTKHTVCVTKADPPSYLSRQETLFVLACKNAKGKTVDADITAGIWSEFTDREVKRVDGTHLFYYKNFLTRVDSAEELIKGGTGNVAHGATFLSTCSKCMGSITRMKED